MDHIPAREWTDNKDTCSILRVSDTRPDDTTIVVALPDYAATSAVALTPEQFGELITDGIRRLALMRGRRAAVEAVAAAVPETRLRGRTEWELTEKAHDALRGTESADTSPAGAATPGTGDGERVPLRDRGAKSTTMWTRRNSSSGNFALRPAEGADTPAAGGSTPEPGDEAPHGPASHPEPVRLLYVTPKSTSPEQVCHDALTEAMTAALNIARKGPRYRGHHYCACGARSANYDVQLPHGGWTNTLALHYLMFHRSEIPADELERAARHLGVDLP